MAVYVVWSTQLGAEESDVPEAAALMADPRARHYWDPTLGVGRAVSARLGLAQPAWDVWLLFDRAASWDDGLPEPAWWEHQLRGAGLPDSLRLDPARFAGKAQSLLGEVGGARREGRPPFAPLGGVAATDGRPR